VSQSIGADETNTSYLQFIF